MPFFDPASTTASAPVVLSPAKNMNAVVTKTQMSLKSLSMASEAFSFHVLSSKLEETPELWRHPIFVRTAVFVAPTGDSPEGIEPVSPPGGTFWRVGR